MLLCYSITAMAVPAKPGWHTIRQSDGTTLQIQAVGNAFNNALLTRDDLTVARGSDGDFYYNSAVTGLTSVRAHEAEERSASEAAFVNVQRYSLTMQPAKPHQLPGKKGKLGVGGSNADSGVPAQGTRKIPIILVEFKDKKFNNTREEIINAMLMGNTSVCQYFRDQSNGLYDPDFEVHGIYSLSQNREYYGGNSGGNDKGLGWMVTEACQMAAADGVSFKPYDTNNDDYCDVVIVIYAGVGEAQASWNHPEAVWPCNWTLDAAAYYNNGGNGAFRPSNGDPLVDTFAVFNELNGSNDNAKTIDGIGTFAHEFGHCLGLPDFYDTGNGGHYGLGRWDIMCMGCYNNDGYTPSGYSAYEKAFMGWIEYITPRPGAYYTLPVMNQKNAATDKALCITSDLNANEYFIIENRRRVGWDSYQPGEGLLITHVTFDADRWWANTPNNQDIQLMTIVPADGTLSTSNENTDTWPRNGKTEFTDSSTPAARLYMQANGSITGSAGYLGKPVTEMVINADGTASFWYMKGAVSDPTISASADNVDCGSVMTGSSATATVKVYGQALTGDVTLTLNDEAGAFTVSPSTISSDDASMGKDVTVTFSPTVIGNYNATLTLSSPGAEDVTITLTGKGLIEGYAPVMLPADSSAINLTQFRADWTDQTPAQNVASYTLEVSPKPAYELMETADFSNVPDGVSGNNLIDISQYAGTYLPQGWSCSSPMYAYSGLLILGDNGWITTKSYDLTGKVTVVLHVASYYVQSYGASSIQVSTSLGSQTITTTGDDLEEHIIVLDCAARDQVTFTFHNAYGVIRDAAIYAGEYAPATLRASETGDATYRLITEITDRFYTVRDLEAQGTYVYRVKTLFADGTESAWSNVEQVTLDGHGYELGDVNHDGEVAIGDVSALIDYLLDSTSNSICTICGDIDGEGGVTIADVSALIDKLLSNN